MDTTRLLERLRFYRAAPPNLRPRIADAAIPVQLPVGHTFYLEGDVGEVFGMVASGDIRVFKTAESGREITLYHVEDGDPCLVNILSVLLGQPAMASARAEAPTVALVFPAAELREWIRSEDAVREFLFATMARRFVDVMTLVEEVAFRKMDARLAQLLLHRVARGGASVDVVVTTHEALAAELGTAREVVSRLLKDFERTGVVSVVRGRIELRDGAELRRVAESL